MNITRITSNNSEAFASLMPAEIAGRDDLFMYGAVSDDKEAVSVLVLEVVDGESVEIVWLYTDPDFRERGAATELLLTASAMLMGLPVRSIGITFTDEDDDLELFLRDRGFLIGDDRSVYAVPLNDVIHDVVMDDLLERFPDTDNIIGVGDKETYPRLEKLLEAQGIEPESIADISPVYSRVALNEDGEAIGCILITELEDSDLEITYFLNTAREKTAIELIADLAKDLRAKNIDDGRLIFTDPRGKSIGLVEKLTGEDRSTYRVDGIYRGVCLLK